MASLKETKLRKLKRSYTGGAMIVFIVMGSLLIAAFGMMLALFGLYISDSKIRDEYAKAKELAHIYTLSVEQGNTSISKVLNDVGNIYFITDENGNIIIEHGENTCDLSSGGVVDILGIAEAANEEAQKELRGEKEIGQYDPEEFEAKVRDEVMTVYPDTRSRIIMPGPEGRIRFNSEIIKSIISKMTSGTVDGTSVTDGLMKFPFWVDVPMDNGSHLIRKSDFVIYFREVAILSIMGLAIAMLTIILIVFTIIFFCSNIRKRKRMTEVFFMDEVTGKHNWMWFLTKAESILKAKRNASNKYAVLDIVFVNYRNFCVCHSVKEGEEMLKRVDEIIQKSITKKELSAHHSAAHFAAMLRYDDIEALKERIRTMISALENIDSTHKFSFWVGVDTIGINRDEKGRIAARKNPDIEIEYNNAGAARATITVDDSAIAFFDEAMVEEQRWMDMIRENQQKALDNEEFVVYYQPKCDPKTEKLKGAEALIRWMHPEKGMISPGRFIPIFESNGFITKIDHYMLSHVAADQRRWLDAGFDCVPVSVNVSRAHFIESDLAEQIRDIVDNAGTPHNLIEIELTESAFFDDKKALITTIERLKEYGFAVSMDDFGSGYSSLNSLKEMPLDVLKLDADFFRNDDGTGRGQIVVSEAIQLAKKLNMRTVAEGVEIRDQVDFLAEQGCDMIQGFVFAKPMPGNEFEQKMAQ